MSHPRKTLVTALALALTAIGAGRPAQAHHSVTAMYDLSKIVTLDGTVRSLELASPHSTLVVEVRDAPGRYSSWQVELPSFSFLGRAGWNDKSLLPGQRIIITGSPARHSSSQLYVRSVQREDGTKLPLLPPAPR